MSAHKNTKQLGRFLTLTVLLLALLPMFVAAVTAWNQRSVVASVDSIAGEHTQLYADYREIISTAYDLERNLHQSFSAPGEQLGERLGANIAAKKELIERIADRSGYAFLDPELVILLRQSFAGIEKDVAMITDLSSRIASRRLVIERKLLQIRAANASLLAATSNVSDNPGMPLSTGNSHDFLRYWTIQLDQIASDGSIADNSLRLQAAKSTYQETIQSAVLALSRKPASATRTEISGYLDSLLQLSRGETGIFSLEAEHLSDVKQLSELQQRASNDIQTLVVTSRDIANSNAEASREMLSKASNGLESARIALIASALFAFLLSMYVIREIIQKRLVHRLRRLCDETRQLASGDLHSHVTEDQCDEIGELQRAMRVFKETAISLEEREHALLKQRKELEAANKELDSFAYIASHDLRAPLRSIDSLASFVVEDLGDEISEDTNRHLGLMRQRIARLDSLLVGLLEYSRIGRKTMAKSVVDLRTLVEESVDVLSRDGFSVSMHGNFPAVETQGAAIHHIVRNLIDNAIKHHDQPKGHIRIACSLIGEECILAVEDDGPGIEPQYHDRVFELFQTLKSRDEVEGSGLGLAMLKKTADRLGGTIRLESNPSEQRGTRFTLRWPVAVYAECKSCEPTTRAENCGRECSRIGGIPVWAPAIRGGVLSPVSIERLKGQH